MFLLILESLGSTELIFILVMALVFFGPRKLPQISRTIGKSMADFRRASEDFKRTWDKEVSLEETGAGANASPFLISDQNSIRDNSASPSLQPPTIGAIAPDRVVARNTVEPESTYPAQEVSESVDEPKHSPKNDWL